MAQFQSPVLITDTAANLPSNAVEGIVGYARDTNALYVYNGSAWVLFAAGAAIDGDKGDITISGSGATYTIDNDVVTYAKMQNVSATSRVLGRATAGAGDVEELTTSQALDFVGSTRGSVPYRAAAGWAILAPGATSGTVLTSNGTGADPSYQNPGGYGLQASAATSATLTDAQTVHFGGNPFLALTTGTTLHRLYIPHSGTIIAAYVYGTFGTAGTDEAWTMYVRLNGTTDTAISTTSTAATTRVWSNTALSIAVADGDYIHIKSINPTWATNPADANFSASLWIR